jgi:hypothetical protein
LQPWYEEKLRAAHLAREAMGAIKAERLRRRIMPDPVADPNGTGLIGVSLSPVTSNSGYLNAKQLSINPNFAAMMVSMLKRAEVNAGDVVAVSLALKKSNADSGACGGRVDVISPWTIFRWLLGRQSWTIFRWLLGRQS